MVVLDSDCAARLLTRRRSYTLSLLARLAYTNSHTFAKFMHQQHMDLCPSRIWCCASVFFTGCTAEAAETYVCRRFGSRCACTSFSTTPRCYQRLYILACSVPEPTTPRRRDSVGNGVPATFNATVLSICKRDS